MNFGYWMGLIVLAVLIAPDALFFIGCAIARAIRRMPSRDSAKHYPL